MSFFASMTASAAPSSSALSCGSARRCASVSSRLVSVPQASSPTMAECITTWPEAKMSLSSRLALRR